MFLIIWVEGWGSLLLLGVSHKRVKVLEKTHASGKYELNLSPSPGSTKRTRASLLSIHPTNPLLELKQLNLVLARGNAPILSCPDHLLATLPFAETASKQISSQSFYSTPLVPLLHSATSCLPGSCSNILT